MCDLLRITVEYSSLCISHFATLRVGWLGRAGKKALPNDETAYCDDRYFFGWDVAVMTIREPCGRPKTCIETNKYRFNEYNGSTKCGVGEGRETDFSSVWSAGARGSTGPALEWRASLIHPRKAEAVHRQTGPDPSQSDSI